MPQQANLVLNDGLATPVARTFSPRGVKGNLATYRDMTSGTPIGQPQITISVEEGKASTKVVSIVRLPTLEVISGSDGGYTPAPKVAYELFSKEESVCSHRSTRQERLHLRAFRANLGDSAVYLSAIADLESIF